MACAYRTRRDSAGWDIARVLRQSEDTTGGGSFGIDRLVLRDAAVVAELAPDSVIRVEDLELRARDLVAGRDGHGPAGYGPRAR